MKESMFCKECGAKIPANSNFCPKCGAKLVDFEFEMPHSIAWYLLPLLFGVIGGLIAFVAIRTDNKSMANNLLGVGIVTKQY